ncbi:MAG: formylglycine-generating enzyme family protein [Victivallales bacterium]
MLEIYGGNPPVEPVKGQDWTISDLNMKMVYIEPGTFMMGSPGEMDRDEDETRHKVILTRGYWICIYEVRQREYGIVMNENPSSFKGDNLPVESVSWYDAVKFCEKLNGRDAVRLPSGYAYRLPTEAEWEYAARGGKKSRGFKYSGGDDVSAVAWYGGNSGDVTHEVGTKSPNELGVYDMSGNVAEWCYDWYGKYSNIEQEDPSGTEGTSSYRVNRGGAWDRNPRNCRPSDRDFYLPGSTNIDTGFRVALAPKLDKNTGNASNAKP